MGLVCGFLFIVILSTNKDFQPPITMELAATL